ncbi:rRNA-processing protein RRP17 NDAI_0A04140 [Naumovozyma dairenensis CBS 421]|uniref:Ribosomal RNA-processing protein 17 n=1 Tax=Naumovozyma dairenensis (strain ATCC 10597 / BCRC 20456 / CBS 421 / NBRC 0211 / NRRL Y-12639) TaxID=1071378 RepID=G0W433_NAUDC|nr:hypothetical protein NDAI_0A04140 [Naumovozyma dairenensis CBS 421]CCD22571.1 hypothetical protein NDAI_0A04140 [Naumovozyma dairenensis CBS 421]
MAIRTNRQILTKGKNYATKQSKKFGADEVTFDKDSRLDYLTGFHKRKLERQKKAKEFNIEQDRLARIEERKKIRDERKEQMEEQMKKFKETLEIQKEIEDDINNAKIGENSEKKKDIDSDSDESWNGFSDHNDDDDADNTKSEDSSSVKPILKGQITAVYSDDTTVEVESLEPNDNFEYIAKLNNVKLEQSEKVLKQSISRATKYAKFLGMNDDDATTDKDKSQKKKKQKKKFRYLTKNERRANQRKANANKYRKK